MKIFRDNVCYIQIGNILSLKNMNVKLSRDYALLNDNDLFVKVTNRDDIKKIKKANYIVDFDKFNDLTLDELTVLRRKYAKKASKMRFKSDVQNNKEHMNFARVLAKASKKLQYTATDLGNLIDIKDGSAELIIPRDKVKVK